MSSHPQLQERESGVPILHDYLDFRGDPLQFWLDTGKLAPAVQVRLGPARTYWLITDADWFAYILAKKSRNFPRNRELRDRNGLDKSETVFTAPTWEEWLWRRRLLQPAFHRKELAKFGETMVSETVNLVEEQTLNTPLDLVQFCKTLTMRVITKTMFSASLAETNQLLHDFEQVTAFSYKRLSAALNLPLWVPTPSVVKTRKAVASRIAIVERIVQDRLDSGKAKGDLLDMLISAHLDEDGRQFTSHGLVSEMLSIIFAGHETTALTLAWLFYELTQKPDIEAKVMAEVDGLNGRLPTLDDLPNMPYTDWVIQEALRVYPPVYITLREAETDDHFDGLDIPSETQLALNIRGIHRDPTHWDDPDRFWPERFDPAREKKRHKFAFLPFIAGPKKCIGDDFAMMEMKLVIPTILQKLRFRYAADQPAKERASFVMETAEPMLMTAEKR